MKTNTFTINKTYALTVKTDKDGQPIMTPIKVSDTATVDAPTYQVEFKTADFRTPDSRYLLDADAFTANVNASATAFIVNDIVNLTAKLTASIDSMISSDKVDLKSVADKMAQRDALNKFVSGKRKSVSSDTIATAFAFAIIQPKYSKYQDSDALIQTIRTAYQEKLSEKSVKAVRDSVTDFTSRYISVTDETKSTVYKNIKVRLSLDATRDLINVVSASPLAYTKKGIVDRTMSTNKAIGQMMLFILRDTFELTVSTVKQDSASYLLIG